MRNRFSDFWLSDNTTDKLDAGEELSPIELAQAKRSISEFVRIMTRQDIPVEFMEEGDQSYTDGETVTIGADVGEEGFDATVGVALHESSHIVRSDFDMLDEFQKADEEDRIPDFVPQEFVDKIEPLLEKSDKYKEIEEKLKRGVDTDYDESELDPENQATRALHHIWNVVEDRWIDQWAYSEAPGYRGYYTKMYEKFWHSEEISEQLQSDEGRDLDWSSYSFRITNITNDSRDLDALPGLRKIWNILDVANIERHETSWDCLDTAKEIMRVVLENAESLYVDPAFGAGDGDGEGTPYEDLPDDLQEMLEDQLDQMQGQAGEELDEEKAEKVDTLEDAGVDTEDVGSEVADHDPSGNSADAAGVPCVVIESMSEAMIEKNNFSIISDSTNRKSQKAVTTGIQKGRILGNRLKIRDERRSTKHPRKRSGKLDSRVLAEIQHSSNLFYTEDIEQYKNGFIHISIDASGSMSGNKFKQAMQTGVAICQAADMIENIRAQVSFRSKVNVGPETRPLIVLAYDSQRDSIQELKKYFPYIRSAGTTPEGLTFEAIQDDILPANQNRESYFVNLSDGKPHFSTDNLYYSGSEAYNHTRSEIQKMKRKGVKILSYYIGEGRRDPDFQTMYGNASRFIDVNDITSIRRTLNEKFLEDDAKKVGS